MLFFKLFICMKKFTPLFLLFMFVFVQVRAQQTINVSTAGTLENTLSTQSINPETVTELTLTGTIDARDFKFMRDNLTILSILDLSNVNIVGYEGTEGTLARPFEYLANTIPEMAFFKIEALMGMGAPIVLTSIVLPESTVGIGEAAFFMSMELTNVVIPASVEIFGETAFASCISLSSVTSLRVEPVSISQTVFDGVNKNNCILYVPESSISYYEITPHWHEFTKIQAISAAIETNFNIPEAGSLASVLSNKGITPAAVIELTLTGSIDARDFKYMRDNLINLSFLNLSNVNIARYEGTEGTIDVPMSFEYPVNVIPQMAFSKMGDNGGSNTLTTLLLPKNIVGIGGSAFAGAKVLKNVTIPESTTSVLVNIGEKAFYDCPLLESIVIPASVEIFGANAFADCITLSSITSLRVNPVAIAQSVFSGVNKNTCVLYVPHETASAYSATQYWSEFTNIQELAEQVGTYVPEAGSLSNVLIDLGLNPNTLTELTLSGTIDARDFKFMRDNMPALAVLDLHHVSIAEYQGTAGTGMGTVNRNYPANVIPERAFILTGLIGATNKTLKTITFPKNLVGIGEMAFASAEQLTNLIFSESSVLKNIDLRAFENCLKLENIVIPASVENIGESAFAYCSSLSSITSLRTVPATIAQNTFFGVNKSICVLYVPAESVSTYRNAQYWSDFTKIQAIAEPLVPTVLHDLFYINPNEKMHVSPNGKYVVATGVNGIGFNWSAEDDPVNLTYSPIAVNDAGQVVGMIPDTRYYVNGSYVSTAGVWENGAWSSLGLGQLDESDLDTPSDSHGARPNGISSDGKIIMGSSRSKLDPIRHVPFSWERGDDGSLQNTTTYSYPGVEANVLSTVSADGRISGGRAIVNDTYQAVIWTSPTDYKAIRPESSGANIVNGISPNGKYAVLQAASRAAIYNIETEEFAFLEELIIDMNTGTVPVTNALAVSDNGIVVGYKTFSVNEGFVWSEKLGYNTFNDFVKTYAGDDIQYPDLQSENSYYFENLINTSGLFRPLGISADGTVMIGWAGSVNEPRMWVLKLSKSFINQPYRPTGLDFRLLARDQIELTWTAPKTEEGFVATGKYNVYRDGVLIGTTTGESFTDNTAPVGLRSYQVTALFGGELESAKSDSKTIQVVDSYDLLLEDFDSYSFDTNYWTVFPNNQVNAGYIIVTPDLDMYSETTTGYEGGALTFTTMGYNIGDYEESFISRPMDGTNSNQILVSFMYKRSVYGSGGAPATPADVLYLEVLKDVNSNEWIAVGELSLNTTDTRWQVASYDISQHAAGNIFKLRFRGAGPNKNATSTVIDNFLVTDLETLLAAPTGLGVKREGNAFVLNWKDPSGSFGLTYANSPRNGYVGNDNAPFIAVNKFEPADLQPYVGSYLTSISAYLNYKYTSIVYPSATIRLAVFVDGQRVVTQAISSYTHDTWNTFALNNPVAIEAGKTILFGIEVLEHYDYPLVIDGGAAVRGKGDLYSEDDGRTWHALSDLDGFNGNWSIIANVKAATSDKERTEGILGYEVYRNDEKVSNLLFGQTFADVIPFSNDICYKVKALYKTGYSELSAAACTDALGIKQIENSSIVAYPNPVKSDLYINGAFVKATLTDLTGRVLLESIQAPIKLSAINEGIYLLKIETNSGTVVKEIIVDRK